MYPRGRPRGQGCLHGLHLWDLPYTTMRGAPRFDGKTFLVFTNFWQEDAAKLPKYQELREM